MRENTGSSKKRKAISATLTIAMVGTMLLSGTLAYFYQSRAKNTITGTEKQVIGHDDFAKVSDTEYNKDIYVENMGSTPVLVRVKLTEAFTLNGKTIADAADKLTHIPEDMGTLTVGTGTNDSDQTADDIHKYFTWKMDGKSKSYISGSSTIYQSAEDKDVFYSYEVGKVAQNNSKKDYSTAAKIDADTTLSAAMKTDLKENLKTTLSGNIITMKEYMQSSPEWRKNFTGWVIDNSEKGSAITDAEGTATTEAANGDGWAYWSQMLKPTEATSLLLNSVTIDPSLSNADYTYDIYVDFEAVDTTEKGIWTNGEQPADESIPVVNIDQIKTTGANVLITTAETVYTDNYGDKITQIEEIRGKSDSKSIQAICDYAINDALKQASNVSPANAQKLAQMAIDMANDILDKQKTPEGRNALSQPVLVYKDDTVTNEGKIKAMDGNLAKYIMDTFDYDHNDILTEEEALSVISFKTPMSTAITNFEGFNLDNFKNLRKLWIFYAKECKEINLHNFIGERTDPKTGTTETVGLDSLIIEGTNSLTSEIDVSILKDTLTQFQLFNVGGTATFTKVSSLENMRYLLVQDASGLKMTTTEICDFLQKNESTLEMFGYSYTNIYADDAKTTAITNITQLTTATGTDGTPFSIPASVSQFRFISKTVKGNLALNNMPKLQYICFGGNADLTCTITACDALNILYKYDGTTINGDLPKGLTIIERTSP